MTPALDSEAPWVVLLELEVCEGISDVAPADSPDDSAELMGPFTPVDAPAEETHSSARPIPASAPNLRPEGQAASSKLQYPGASQNPARPPTLHSVSSVH